MKRFLAYILIGTFCFSLVGCQNDTRGSSSETTTFESMSVDTSEATKAPENTVITEPTLNSDLSDDWRTHPEDFKLVAFTFDDAPSYKGYGNNMGSRIVDLFDEYEGAATFFVTGKNIDKNGVALLEYAIDHGFEIGNHTYNHLKLTELSRSEIKKEIENLNHKISDLLNIEPKFVRPGYLAANNTVYDVCTELGMHPIHEGTVSVRDSSSDSKYDEQYIYDTVMNNVSDGTIILMHDWAGKTDKAIQRIIPELYEQGYRFVNLTELFEYKGIAVESLPTDRWIKGVANGQIR